MIWAEAPGISNGRNVFTVLVLLVVHIKLLRYLIELKQNTLLNGSSPFFQLPRCTDMLRYQDDERVLQKNVLESQ